LDDVIIGVRGADPNGICYGFSYVIFDNSNIGQIGGSEELAIMPGTPDDDAVLLVGANLLIEFV